MDANKNGWEMFECARDTSMNRGVNERKAFHEYALGACGIGGYGVV
jgi:hypothetical protein